MKSSNEDTPAKYIVYLGANNFMNNQWQNIFQHEDLTSKTYNI